MCPKHQSDQTLFTDIGGLELNAAQKQGKPTISFI